MLHSPTAATPPAGEPGSRLPVSQGGAPDPIDSHIGRTFQQVQKYERGGNRIAGSMLWRIVQALDLPISALFDGLPGAVPSGVPVTEAASLTDARMMRAWRMLAPGQRQNLLAIAENTATLNASADRSAP